MMIRRETNIAVLEYTHRVWAVAAVHGQAFALRRLHQELWPRFRRGDRLVYLGNYLGYGNEICETLDELLSFRHSFLTIPGIEARDLTYLRGNQEEMWWKLLQIQLATNPIDVFNWMVEHGLAATLQAYGGDLDEARSQFRTGVVATTRWTSRLREAMKARPGHDQLLIALCRAAMTEDGELLFVNAGLDPNRDLDCQRDAFWWENQAFDHIDRDYRGFRRIVRGFDPMHRGIRLGDFTASIDGGCGFGGGLMAVCFGLDGEIADHIEIPVTGRPRTYDRADVAHQQAIGAD